ncbi:MAG TPA: hypothetical protein VFG87_24160, partial [Amycolatopsis sp.]|nr:hypothetical protein [Amycolatopsis sp.]
MRLFRRRDENPPPDPRTAWPRQEVPADPEAAAIAFWRGWVELLPQINAALGDREPQRVEYELCRLVAGVHPDLHFSLERGQRAIYALVVTGQEDPGLRPYTDAWKSVAPAEDAIWEYHDAVPPVPDPTGVTVNLGAHRISLADVRVGVTAVGESGTIDVVVYHPRLAELDEQARTVLTFLPLDATLGERLAGERLRRVEVADAAPDGAITLLELRELVRGPDRRSPED